MIGKCFVEQGLHKVALFVLREGSIVKIFLHPSVDQCGEVSVAWSPSLTHTDMDAGAALALGVRLMKIQTARRLPEKNRYYAAALEEMNAQ